MNRLVIDLTDADVEVLEQYRDMIKDNSEGLEELSSMIALMVVSRLGSLEKVS